MDMEYQSNVAGVISGSSDDRSSSNSNSAGSLRIGMDGSLNHPTMPSLATDMKISGVKCVPSDEGEVSLEEESKKNSGDGKQSSCRKHFGCFLLILAVLLGGIGGITGWLLHKQAQKGDDSSFLLLEHFDATHIVATVPDDICFEWIPGEGKSDICSEKETEQLGGKLCNLVAKSLLHAVDDADIAIINAGICHGDVASGEMTVGTISDVIEMEDLVVVDMAGAAIKRVLEDALDSTFENNDSAAYPYAAGVRYNVKGNLDYNNRVDGLEIFFDKAPIWVRIDPYRFYSVVTTTSLGEGGLGYAEFRNVIEAWKTPLSFHTGDAFFNYAAKNSSWSVLDTGEYSTQSFVQTSTIADVPHYIPLEDGNSCNLLVWGLLDQVSKADVAVLNSGVCGSNIEAGAFELEDAQALVLKDPSLLTIRLLGSHILEALEKSVDGSLAGRPYSYPYAAALRFDVNALSSVGNRVSNVQTLNRSNRWIALSHTKTYTVLTTSDLSSGRNNDYSAFLKGDSSRPTSPSSAVDVFVGYATEWKFLYNPPPDKYSTQTYVAK
eukprot:scaffold1525_cov142-Cylindrotheca_fusiformis.AAC.186